MNHRTGLLFAFSFLAFSPAIIAQSPLPVKSAPADPLDAAWRDLLQPDETRATRAALLFGSKPAEAVTFLKAKLVPVKADPKLLAKLITDLGNKEFQVRDAAQAELEYFSRFIKSDLEQAMKVASDEETKTRIGKLLARIEAEDKEAKQKEDKPAAPIGGPGASVSIRTVNGVTTVFINGQPIDTTPKVITKLGPLQTWVRASRAIGILEHIGTPEAVKLLESLSLGEDNALPTKQAQEALARLKRSK
jgi:hypothetical protein